MADNQEKHFPRDEHSYEIVDQIGGDGVHTTVVKALCTAACNSSKVAIKIIHLDKSRPYFTVQTIAKATAGVTHPNILTPHCWFTSGDRLWVVMPFISGGSLQSLIPHPFPDGLSEACIAVVLKQLLSAIYYLYAKGRTHRDVKPGNILIDSDGSVKLSDIGYSATFYESPPPPAVLERPYWAEPEGWHSYKTDVWSLGITALELFHGKPIARLPLSKSMVGKIGRRFHFAHFFHDHITKRRIWRDGKDVSELFVHMVGECLVSNPMDRPSPETLLRHHPFIKNCTDGPDFLVRNLRLQGFPRLEKRFKKPVAVDESDGSDLNRGRIKWYWKFNRKELMMVPEFEEAVAKAATDGASASTSGGGDPMKEERKGLMVKGIMAKIAADLNVEREMREKVMKELEILEGLLPNED